MPEDIKAKAEAVKVAAIFGAGPEGPPVAFEIYPVARGQAAAMPERAKVAVAEIYARRARDSVSDSTQKRRDVELVYELVLVLSADAKEDRDLVRRLRVELSAARDRVRSSPPVRSLDELLRHLRHTARRDPRTAFRSPRALYDRSLEGGDAEAAKVAAQRIPSLVPRGAREAVVNREEARRLLGWSEPPRLEAGERLAAGGKAGLDDQLGDVLAQLAFDLDEDQARALAMASGAARFFDIEGSLSEELVEAETRAIRPVQRRAGSRAFYHHLSDLEILLACTEFDSAFRTLLPTEAPMGPDTLEKLLPHLEALEAIALGRPAEAVELLSHAAGAVDQQERWPGRSRPTRVEEEQPVDGAGGTHDAGERSLRGCRQP